MKLEIKIRPVESTRSSGLVEYRAVITDLSGDKEIRTAIQTGPMRDNRACVEGLFSMIQEAIIQRLESWEAKFGGKCDVCGKPKSLIEVKPGVQFGWKVGYICCSCSKTP